MVSRGRLILRGSPGGLPKNQSVACEARHAPTGLRAGRVPLVEVWKLRGLEAWLFQRLHPSRACRALCSLWPWKVWRVAPARSVLCSPGRVSAPCPACASTPPVSVPLCLLCGLCVLRNLRFPILAVLLCAPLWSFVFFVIAPQGKPSTLSQRLHPSRACRALRFLFSVLRSPLSGAAQLPRREKSRPS